MGTKRGFDEMNEEVDKITQGKKHHKDDTTAAIDNFYSNLPRNLGNRAKSRLYHMRNFNGWVKATQIAELNPLILPNAMRPLRVLDLACGKGGDLQKWSRHRRGLKTYCGIDCARGSLQEAALRVQGMGRMKHTKVTLICADIGADVPGRKKSPSDSDMQELLTWSLQDEAVNSKSNPPKFKMVTGGGIAEEEKFDVVSIQFAIHYMMSTHRRARRFFHTVSKLLDIGGNLICTTIDARVLVGHLMRLNLDHVYDGDNKRPDSPSVVEVGGGACKIIFDYETVSRIMKQSDDGNLFGLQYKFALFEGSSDKTPNGYAVNLPEWLTPLPVLKTLAEEAGLELEYEQNFHEFYHSRKEVPSARRTLRKMKVLDRNGTISQDEWDICRLYAAMKFRKVRESSINLDNQEESKQSGDAKDNKVSASNTHLPIAMMNAKKTAGVKKWKSLSSTEKKLLIEKELELLL